MNKKLNYAEKVLLSIVYIFSVLQYLVCLCKLKTVLKFVIGRMCLIRWHTGIYNTLFGLYMFNVPQIASLRAKGFLWGWK